MHPSPEYTLDAEMAEPLVSRGGGYDLDIDLDFKDKKDAYKSGYNLSCPTAGDGRHFSRKMNAGTEIDDGVVDENEDEGIHFDGTSDSLDL